MRRKRVIRKAFATLSVFLALLLACGIAFPSQARAEEAEIEAQPIAHNAVVLVLDDSGSMDGSPRERLREAAKKFSEKILEADEGAKIAIVAFSDSIKVLLFTSNLNEVRSFVDNRMGANGGTDVTLGLEGADTTAKLLQDSAFDRYAKSIVTMSDGEPNDDDSAIRRARSMFPNYNMYSVGFFKSGDNAEAIEFLKSIQNSGYFEANDLDALIKKFIEIADELLNPVEISLSHDYTRDKADGEPIDKRSFILRAEIKNPNSQKMVRNLKVTIKLPKELTLQEGTPEKTWDKLVAGQTKKLEWKVKASDSASGALVYSVIASGDNIINLAQSDKITLDAQNDKNNQLTYKDTWEFKNDDKNFGDRYFLTDDDKKVLLDGLSEKVLAKKSSEKQRIENNIEKKWKGCCYGFAVSAVLNKMGVASPLQRQEGAKCLHDMNPSKDVQSYINYYYFTQYLDSNVITMVNFYYDSSKKKMKSAKERMDTLVERVKLVAHGGSPVILSFGWNNYTHTVVADKFESKPGGYTGIKVYDLFGFDTIYKDYTGRIRYYDSIDPGHRGRYLYVDTNTGEFALPDYKKFYDKSDLSTKNVHLLEATNDLSLLNGKDLNTPIENEIALLTAKSDTAFHNARIQRKDGAHTQSESEDGTWDISEVAEGKSDLMRFWDRDGVDSGSPLNIVLPDNKEDYSVSSPDVYDYSLKYPDAFLLVQSAGAESASFERGGTVKLAHNTGSYKLTSTLDSATGDLYTFGVTGTDGGNVELRKTEGGYVIKADSLKGATAEASGDDVTKSIALDGDATEVQISSDGTDITASIDEDGDGVFEKIIGSSAQNGKQGQGGNHGKDDSHGRDDQRQDGKAKDDQRQDGKAKDDNHGRDDQGQRVKQGKDDNKQNKGDDGTPGPTDQGSKVSSTFNGNAGSARVSDVQPERGGGDLPKTGDSSPLFMVLPLAVLGALATVLGIVLRRRRGDADSGGVDG